MGFEVLLSLASSLASDLVIFDVLLGKTWKELGSGCERVVRIVSFEASVLAELRGRAACAPGGAVVGSRAGV